MQITRRRCLVPLGTAAIAACLLPPLFSASAGAADKPNPKQAFLDADAAGPDFAIQGEYEGTHGSAKLGAQVIALGNGNFRAVLYTGGLPGAGWDGKTKISLPGQFQAQQAEFSGSGYSGTVTASGSGFSGKDDQGVAFSLNKVLRKSPTLSARPPEGAMVLFDGTDVKHWQKGKLEEGNLLGVGTRTKQEFRDFELHLEFRTPFMPFARGQGRGNSGMYLLDQYEVQVLDSFGLEGVDNECGGIYKVARPSVNMCLPPLSWQTYDVEFRAARLDENGRQTAPAVATIRHNGVVIHDGLELKSPTPGGGRNDQKPGPLFLQNHGDPVRFRNIWVVEKQAAE